MTEGSTATRSVVVEREVPFPPDRVWRALTQPHLIGEWLMRTDFEAVIDRPFTLSGDWGSVEGRVLEAEAPRSLSYSWDAFGLESVVTWTLTPAGSPPGAGTHLRMEQSGFRADQDQFHQGAQASWPGYLQKLEEVLARVE